MPARPLAMVVLVAVLALAPPCLAADDTERFDDLIGSVERSELLIVTAESAAPVIEELQQALPPDDLDRRSRLDAVVCEWAFSDNREEKWAFAEARLATYREVDHAEGVVRMLRCRGDLKRDAGDFVAGVADFNEALETASTLDDPLLLARVLRSRGDAHSFHGDFVLALEDFLSAHGLLEGLGEVDLAARLYFDIGALYRRLGAYEEAKRFLAHEIEAADATGDVLRATLAHIQMGFAAYDQGDGALAEDSFRTAVDMARRTGNDVLIGNAKVALGSAFNLQGAHEQALEQIERAQALYDRTGYALNSVMAALQRGVAHAGLGQHQQAVAEFQALEPVLVERDQKRHLALLYPARANSLQATGRLSEALADWRAHNQVRVELERLSQRDRSDLLRVQFDVSRREIENERLRTETLLQEERLAALARTRTWQTLSLTLALLLGIGLALALVAQGVRTRRLHIMAMTDELTGVANRRRIELYLADQLRLCRKRNRPLSVISLDIDQFKAVNDTWGHLAGDVVLERVCRVVAAKLLRANDVIGRIGGDEFLVVLPDTPIEAARTVAERLRAAVHATGTSDVIGQPHVTISLGVAMANPGDTIKDLEVRVDDALYRAKTGGRGRVELSHA